jgi:medium-chain acyl-[acyl-carrier-protein] hydrolase
MSETRKSDPQAASQWFTRPKSNQQARLRLFCFPYAGGNAHAFSKWPQQLPPGVEVLAAQLPGRASRIREPPHTGLHALVEELGRAVRPYLDVPFAFFGHSMGAMIGFELARLLRREGVGAPTHLFVSGRRAPQIPNTDALTYNLPDAELIEQLRRLNGTPPAVLEHPELMQLMLPLLRADFEVVETYRYVDEPPLDCPISAFGGLQDPEVTREQLEAWRAQTTSGFVRRMFDGDHFFLHRAEPLLLRTIARELHEQGL